MALPQPTPEVGMKLASAVVHANEGSSRGRSAHDWSAFAALRDDPDVQAYMRELHDLALLPIRRDAR